MSGLFITGTGTGIGKTFVTAALIRACRRRGREVEALKPVVSGFNEDEAASSDPGILLAALGRPASREALHRIAPWRFKAPLAPDLAAERERRSLDFDAVVDFSRRAVAAAGELLFIEGVGGIMVPLDASRTVLDWMSALRLPVLLVAGSYLGTLSHSLSALEVLRQRGLAVTALIVDETQDSSVTLADTVASLARFAHPIEVLALPFLSEAAEGHPTIRRIADLVCAAGAASESSPIYHPRLYSER